MSIQLKKSGSMVKRSKLSFNQSDNQQNLLIQTTNLLETLAKMRFIQKISRPIDKRLKQQYVEKFAGKMEILHHKLKKINQQIVQRTLSENINNQKQRSIQGSITNKYSDWRKIIREIQSKYIQMFYEGSFKHYGKLISLYGFTYKLDLINIQQWASKCLNSAQQPQNICCC